MTEVGFVPTGNTGVRLPRFAGNRTRIAEGFGERDPRSPHPQQLPARAQGRLNAQAQDDGICSEDGFGPASRGMVARHAAESADEPWHNYHYTKDYKSLIRQVSVATERAGRFALHGACAGHEDRRLDATAQALEANVASASRTVRAWRWRRADSPGGGEAGVSRGLRNPIFE
jgi:hypothetical protein